MEKTSQIALANMAYYYLTKGRITLAINCLEELSKELNNAENINKNSSIKPIDDKRNYPR